MIFSCADSRAVPNNKAITLITISNDLQLILRNNEPIMVFPFFIRSVQSFISPVNRFLNFMRPLQNSPAFSQQVFLCQSLRLFHPRLCSGIASELFLDPPANRLFMAWLYHIGFLRNGSSWSPLTSSQMVRPIWGPRSAFCVLSPSPSGKISPLEFS